MQRLVLFTVTLGLAAAAAARAGDFTGDLIENYQAASQEREQRLRGASMDVEISAAVPKLKRTASMHALRKISSLGKITYEKFRFEGDNSIKRDVIARFLSAEIEAQKQDARSLAISPANYKFHYMRDFENHGRQVHVFRVKPKKKRPGMFRGEIWVDADTFMPLREAGRLSVSPSIFVKSVEFVRDYKLQDRVAVPQHFAITAETRLAGRAEMSVDYSHITLEPEPAAGLSVAGNALQ